MLENLHSPLWHITELSAFCQYLSHHHGTQNQTQYPDVASEELNRGQHLNSLSSWLYSC